MRLNDIGWYSGELRLRIGVNNFAAALPMGASYADTAAALQRLVAEIKLHQTLSSASVYIAAPTPKLAQIALGSILEAPSNARVVHVYDANQLRGCENLTVYIACFVRGMYGWPHAKEIEDMARVRRCEVKYVEIA